MITQYSDSNSSPSADIQNLIANKCSILDRYIVMQTGQYEYTGLVYNPCTKKCKEYTISRSSTSGYSTQYIVTEKESSFDYRVTNEYYVYSNDGVGKSLDLPVTESVIAYSLLIISCVLMFAIVFKGVLFKCLQRKR